MRATGERARSPSVVALEHRDLDPPGLAALAELVHSRSQPRAQAHVGDRPTVGVITQHERLLAGLDHSPDLGVVLVRGRGGPKPQPPAVHRGDDRVAVVVRVGRRRAIDPRQRSAPRSFRGGDQCRDQGRELRPIATRRRDHVRLLESARQHPRAVNEQHIGAPDLALGPGADHGDPGAQDPRRGAEVGPVSSDHSGAWVDEQEPRE